MEKHTTNNHQERRICTFSEKGYCRFGRHCRFQHFNQICANNGKCQTLNCGKRHPLPCKFGLECVFGKRCAFAHEVVEYSIDDENEESRKVSEDQVHWGDLSSTRC